MKMVHKKLPNEEEQNITKSIIFIVILIFAFFLIKAGLFSKDKQDPEIERRERVYDREPLCETKMPNKFNCESIEISFIEEQGMRVFVNAGKGTEIKRYSLNIDDDFVQYKDTTFVYKTNDTYKKIEDTEYYLYAVRKEDGSVYVGLAK